MPQKCGSTRSIELSVADLKIIIGGYFRLFEELWRTNRRKTRFAKLPAMRVRVYIYILKL